MTDLASFLRARYAERRAIAEGAARGGAGSWTQVDPDRKDGWIEDEAGNTVIFDEGSPTGEQAHHIATNDPVHVITDIDAKLALLDDLLAERHNVIEDCWYTCAAATEERDGGESCDEDRQGGPCDCGRDARVNRRLRLLARPFAGHPEFQDTWASDTPR
ncbi:DUF6221 family protein [[Kitasatospora] papulosa]|uniref:DUF6221 family protein n=1 Tax=[Kitasatospora] papulosa TaxID=1464011 RepID=UPI00369664F0